MSAWDEADVNAMHSALDLAAAAESAGEVPVGAVVVAGGEIIGRGHNRTIGDHDPAGHAEIIALREAARRSGNHRLTTATLYVTLEPCPMCMGAIAEARVPRVVFGAYDEKGGAAGSVIDLSASKALRHRPEINGGLLRDDCGGLLRRFFLSRR
jgi:tRNA(adenine34) deaminase